MHATSFLPSIVPSLPPHLLVLPTPQLLALANGDRVKDKQRSRIAYVVDEDKILAARSMLVKVASRHHELLEQVIRAACIGYDFVCVLQPCDDVVSAPHEGSCSDVYIYKALGWHNWWCTAGIAELVVTQRSGVIAGFLFHPIFHALPFCCLCIPCCCLCM